MDCKFHFPKQIVVCLEDGLCVTDTFETRYRELKEDSFVIEVQRTDSIHHFGVELEISWEVESNNKLASKICWW